MILGCMSKCATCKNEFSCLTYKSCQGAMQTLTSAGACAYNCKTGLHLTKASCGTCSDTNCKICETYTNSTTGTTS